VFFKEICVPFCEHIKYKKSTLIILSKTKYSLFSVQFPFLFQSRCWKKGKTEINRQNEEKNYFYLARPSAACSSLAFGSDQTIDLACVE